MRLQYFSVTSFIVPSSFAGFSPRESKPNLEHLVQNPKLIDCIYTIGQAEQQQRHVGQRAQCSILYLLMTGIVNETMKEVRM